MIDSMFVYNPSSISKNMTRGGPLAFIPSGYQMNFGIISDSRKAVVFNTFVNHYRRSLDGYNWNVDASLRWKPSSNISLSVGPGYSYRISNTQWVTRVDDSLMTSTYGTRYVFGRINQKTLSASIRLNWTFTPKLTLQLYLQPFIAVGSYDEFKELAAPKEYKYNTFGDGPSTISYADGVYIVDPDGLGPADSFSFGNPDFNLKSLRGTAVLRWEYLPGSILYVVWTQNRADYSNPGNFNLRRDLGDLFTAPGDNIFLIKFSYRWNI